MSKLQLYQKLARYYDKLYHYKDYKMEAEFINQIIEEKWKRKVNILDLACGTGNHVKEFVNFGHNVVGIDVSEEMLKIAKTKVPEASFIKSGMQNFSLNQKFEVITCLFSSIQYNLTINQLKKVFKCSRNHLTSDGLFIFDVAYCQERWKEGYTVISIYKGPNLELGLFAQSRSKNKISIWQPLILIKDHGQIDLVVDSHKIRIFSINEILQTLKEVGFKSKIYSNFQQLAYKRNGDMPVFVCQK